MRLFQPLTLSVCGLTCLLSACATPENNYDPLEPVNRKIYGFNDAVDRAVLKPVAGVYAHSVEKPVQESVGNFFSNVGELWDSANHVLQGQFLDGAKDLSRFVVNSTLGVGGLFDPASDMGLEKKSANFGQTLGKWGVGSGPYLVIPFLGPNTLRDSSDLVLTSVLSPYSVINNKPIEYGITALRLVDKRASLLDASRLLDDGAIDAYAFMRDSILQKNYADIYDGTPPTPLVFGNKASATEEVDDLSADLQAIEQGTEPSSSAEPASGATPVDPLLNDASALPVESAPAAEEPKTSGDIQLEPSAEPTPAEAVPEELQGAPALEEDPLL